MQNKKSLGQKVKSFLSGLIVNPDNDTKRNIIYGEDAGIEKYHNSFKNEAGKILSYRDNALVHSAINKIAVKCSDVKFFLLEIQNSRGETLKHEIHPILDLLEKPNKYQTYQQFFQIVYKQIVVKGNCLIVKEKDDNGNLESLEVIDPDKYTLRVRQDGSIYFEIYSSLTFSAGLKRDLEYEDVIYISTPDITNSITQCLGISHLAEKLSIEKVITEYNISGLLSGQVDENQYYSIPQSLRSTEVDKIKQDIKKKKLAREPLVLSHGAEIKTSRISPKEIDYIRSVDKINEQILRGLGVPELFLGKTENANRNNSEISREIFAEFLLEPLISLVRDKLNNELIQVEFGDVYNLAYDELISKNIEFKVNTAMAMVERGILSREKALELITDYLNYEQVSEEDIGEDPIQPIQLKLGAKVFRGKSELFETFKNIESKARKLIESNNKKGKLISLFDSEESKSGFYQVIASQVEDRADKVVGQVSEWLEFRNNLINNEFRRQMNALIRRESALKKKIKQKLEKGEEIKSQEIQGVDINIRELAATSVAFAYENRETKRLFLEILKEIERRVNVAELGPTLPPLTDVSDENRFDIIDERSRFFLNRTQKSNARRLVREINRLGNEGKSFTEIRDAITGRLKDVSLGEAERIARTESAVVGNKIQLQSYIDNGYQGKEWITRQDNDVRDPYHREQHGRVIGISERFVVRQAKGSPRKMLCPEDYNERCTLSPAIQTESSMYKKVKSFRKKNI